MLQNVLSFLLRSSGFRGRKNVRQNPSQNVVCLQRLTFIRVQSGCPSAWVRTPPWPPLCAAVSALKRGWAGAGQAMLVLTAFLAVVVGIKLTFYVNMTGVEQTHACVEEECNLLFCQQTRGYMTGTWQWCPRCAWLGTMLNLYLVFTNLVTI